MRKPVRNLLVVASAGMLAFGGLSIAGPAAAGTWGGHLSCGVSQLVASNGYKGNSNPMTVSAPGITVHLTTTTSGYWKSYRGDSRSGSWYVTGTGATDGFGSCN